MKTGLLVAVVGIALLAAAVGYVAYRRWQGSKALVELLAFLSGKPIPEDPALARQRAAMKARLDSLSRGAPLRDWLALLHADTNNTTTDQVFAHLGARPALASEFDQLLISRSDVDRRLGLRWLGILKTVPATTAGASESALRDVVKMLTAQPRPAGIADSWMSEEGLFSAVAASEALWHAGHRNPDLVRQLRSAIVGLGQPAEHQYLISLLQELLDH